QCLRAHQIERHQRGVEMKISCRCCSCLTVQEPGELFAVAEEKLDLETRGVEVEKSMTIQIRVSRTQDDETRLGWVLLVEEDHDGSCTCPMRINITGSKFLRNQGVVSAGSNCAESELLQEDRLHHRHSDAVYPL